MKLIQKKETSKASLENVIFEFTNDQFLIKQYKDICETEYNNVWGVSGQGGYDDFDKGSRFFIARYGSKCIGGARIIIKTPNNNNVLPAEFAGLNLRKELRDFKLEHNSYCEISRFARLPEYGGFEFAMKFFGSGGKRLIALNVPYVFFISPKSLARNYRIIGKTIIKYKILDLKHINMPDNEIYSKYQFQLSCVDLTEQIVEYNKKLQEQTKKQTINIDITEEILV